MTQPASTIASVINSDRNQYVVIPASAAAQLHSGWIRPMPVRLRINRTPRVAWCLNLTPVGDGSFRLHLNEVVRRINPAAWPLPAEWTLPT